MKNILFINTSPRKDKNTYLIGKEVLKNTPHDELQLSDYKISQYGQIYEDDQINEVLDIIKNYDTLLIGSPVYWYSVGGLLKTFIDRLYMLPKAENLKGKKLYFFAQGSAPDKGTEETITFLVNRLAKLMGMDLKKSVVDNSAASKIKKEINI